LQPNGEEFGVELREDRAAAGVHPVPELAEHQERGRPAHLPESHAQQLHKDEE